jgi:DNA-binding NarL/FixJ family response regulator
LALAAILALRPDIFLLELGLLCGDTRPLHEIRDGSPSTRVILIGDCETEAAVSYFLQHGAKGCLPTDTARMHMIRAVRAVHGGEIWIGRAALAHMLGEMRAMLGQHVPAAVAATLTAREAEILAWIRSGFTNKEVGRRLGIRPSTVKTHLQHIYEKLDISRRGEL